MKKRIQAEPMTNQERFEHWMKEIIFHVDRCNFNKMENAMSKITN
jgi:hypothetical protein